MKKMDLNLMVNIFKEGKSYVAYSPDLDLSSSGKTQTEAKRMFAEAALLFIEELQRKGNLEKVLKQLGWQIKRSEMTPPKQNIVDVRVPVCI